MLLHSNSNRSDNEDENKNVVIQLQKIDPIIKNWLELEWFFQSGGEEEANVQHNFISSWFDQMEPNTIYTCVRFFGKRQYIL